MISWSRLDARIAEYGEDGLLSELCGRVSEGEHPFDVAKTMGVAWNVMKRWLEDDERRMEELSFAKRCYADKLAWDSLSEVRDADVETVALAKLRSDKYEKMAGKFDRGSWGDKTEERNAGITVVVQRGGVVSLVDGSVVGTHTVEIPAIDGEVIEADAAV